MFSATAPYAGPRFRGPRRGRPTGAQAIFSASEVRVRWPGGFQRVVSGFVSALGWSADGRADVNAVCAGRIVTVSDSLRGGQRQRRRRSGAAGCRFRSAESRGAAVVMPDGDHGTRLCDSK